MHILSEEQYRVEAEPLFQKVFITKDPSAVEIFTPSIVERRIFYANVWFVEGPLMDAIAAAAVNLGDRGYYISRPWRSSFSSNHPNHCYISFSDYFSDDTEAVENRVENKLKIPLVISDYFMYSSQGKWGVLHSSAKYGLLGGTPEFIAEISTAFPSLDEQVYEFLRYWRDDRDYYSSTAKSIYVSLESWLPQLLTHIYGQEAAVRLLQEMGLP